MVGWVEEREGAQSVVVDRVERGDGGDSFSAMLVVSVMSACC